MTQAHVAAELIDALFSHLSVYESGFFAWYQELPSDYVFTVLRPDLQKVLLERLNSLGFAFSRVSRENL